MGKENGGGGCSCYHVCCFIFHFALACQLKGVGVVKEGRCKRVYFSRATRIYGTGFSYRGLHVGLVW